MALRLTSKHGGFVQAPRSVISSRSGDNSQEKWLLKTCRLLRDNEWPSDRRLHIDGSSSFPPSSDIERRDVAHLAFLDALMQNNTVTMATLRNITFCHEQCQSSLEKILSCSTKLRSLKLDNVSINVDVQNDENNDTNNSRANNTGRGILPHALFQNLHIEELVVENCTMNQEEMNELAQMIHHSKSLTKLKLLNVSISDTVTTTKVSKALNTSTSNITHLDLSQTKLGKERFIEMLTSLQSNSTLESLILDDCEMHVEYAAHIATLLRNNSSMKELSLNGNTFDSESIRVIVQDGLRSNSSVTTLSLNGNPIGDNGAIHLANLLCDQSTVSNIQSLSIIDCEIWTRGYHEIALGIATMNRLQELMVDGTEMEEHSQTLLKSIKQNMVLRKLVMAQSNVYMLEHDEDGDTTWKQIFWYLNLNRIGRRQILQKQNISAKLWSHVLQCSTNHPDYLFYMLQHKPEFCGCATSTD